MGVTVGAVVAAAAAIVAAVVVVVVVVVVAAVAVAVVVVGVVVVVAEAGGKQVAVFALPSSRSRGKSNRSCNRAFYLRASSFSSRFDRSRCCMVCFSYACRRVEGFRESLMRSVSGCWVYGLGFDSTELAIQAFS